MRTRWLSYLFLQTGRFLNEELGKQTFQKHTGCFFVSDNLMLIGFIMTPGIFIKYANSSASFTCVCACVFEGSLDEDRCFSLHTAGNCLQVRVRGSKFNLPEGTMWLWVSRPPECLVMGGLQCVYLGTIHSFPHSLPHSGTLIRPLPC